MKILQQLMILAILVKMESIASEEKRLPVARNATFVVNDKVVNVELDHDYNCKVTVLDSAATRKDYVYTRGIGSHKLHTKAKTWNEARKTCQMENAELAIINSRLEAKILSDMLKNASDIIENNKSFAYLGFHDLYAKDEWVTLSNQPLSTTGYTQGIEMVPNNTAAYLLRQHCGALENTGDLYAIYCDQEYGFFCELHSL